MLLLVLSIMAGFHELRGSSLNMANIGIFLAMLWPNSFAATPNAAENPKARSDVQRICAKPASFCFLPPCVRCPSAG